MARNALGPITILSDIFQQAISHHTRKTFASTRCRQEHPSMFHRLIEAKL
jgi:hypothetical protein